MSFFKKRAIERSVPGSLDLNSLSDVTYFLEHHPDAVYTMDTKGHFISFNNKFPLLLGYDRTGLKNIHFEQFLQPDEKKRINEIKKRVYSGETVHFTAEVRHQSGHMITLNVTNIPIYEQRVIVGLYGIARDISQQKEFRTDYQRLLMKERLADTLEGVTFLEYIPATKKIITSASLAPLLALSKKHVTKMDTYDFLEELHPEDRPGFREQSRLLHEGAIDEFSMTLRMGRRSQFKKIIHCEGVIQSETTPTSILFILQDETPLVMMEKERDLAIASLKKFFTSLDTTVYEHRYEDNTVTFHATGFLEPYASYLKQIERDHQLWTKLVSPDDLPAMKAVYPTIQKGDVVRLVYRLDFPNQQFWLEETCIPIIDASGTVIGHYGVSTDITRLKEQQHEIWHLSMHDAITDLPNRAFVLDHISELLTHRSPFTLMAVTFNQYSVIYERFGHEVGDEWMRQTSATLKRLTQKDVFISHLFGDKFLLILKGKIDEVRAIKLAHQLLDLTEHRFDIMSYELFAKVYVGITYSVHHDHTAEELLKQTYTALRRAKSMSKSNYQFYSTKLDIEMYRRYELERDLRDVIARNELFLEYQPKVNSWSGQIVGAEALIRWNHPQWGRLSPKDFLSLSEESDLYIHIGDWVLDQVCRLLRELLDHNPSQVVPLSINLSPKRLFYGDFAALVEQQLKRHRIPGHLLEIELLESDILLEGGQVLETLEKLVALDVKLSLDDFGTAYSSISYIQRYPIHCLKIDRSFAIHAEQDPKSLSVIKSIIYMAKEFGLDVVAEGVETLPQLQLYRELECDMIQGYLFSKPIDVLHLKQLLLEGTLYPTDTGTASPKEPTLSLHAKVTITKLNNKVIQVGSSPILINRCTSQSVFFYSSIRLPVQQQLELSLKLNDLTHPELLLRPVSITELDNGFFYYTADFHIRALSIVVQEQLNLTHQVRIDDFFEASS
ncbi:GGDEF domain-containing phosphodiesterase [Exiguobacterium undae]|uniref:Diguanylate cyclase/phosphodiesterase with PAS/PAC sensor(S) n=1 Tax=Exiguobacterium undae TaxID=169177 RepID=A0ABX2V526_9BACL|nr:GGDEF domain-containing phosphodiesterase [Exiguobacterium undae]OAN10172.1 hypothetical protein A3783_14360 [Exiguobacterium undae]